MVTLGYAMVFLLRLISMAFFLAALGYAALYALGTFVTPEPRDITITLPPPKSKP